MPDRHVSVIVVGSSQQDHIKHDSSSLGSPSPQAEQEHKTSFVGSLSPPQGFEGTECGSEAGSSVGRSYSSAGSEDGRASAHSKRSGASLRIDGTTVEETSTDLSIDLGRQETGHQQAGPAAPESEDSGQAGHVSDDQEEVEDLPEEPIIPVLKTEPPKKLKGIEERKPLSEAAPVIETERQTQREKVKKSSREEKSRKVSDDAKIARQEKERERKKREREGRERYDRRSQDRLDNASEKRHDARPAQINSPTHQDSFETKHRRKESGDSKHVRKESVENNFAEPAKKLRNESDKIVIKNKPARQEDKIGNKENQPGLGRHQQQEPLGKPDLIGSSTTDKQTPVKNKAEVYKKTGRSTSEASVLHPPLSPLADSDPEEVILRRKPALPEVAEEKHEIGAAIERKRPMTKEDIQKMNLKKKTRKRTRKFEIDGVTVTTTTSKVIYRDEESETFYDEHYFRKQELRDLKLLQKQEQKQFQDLAFKNQLVKEQQEKRFEVERVTLMKNYDNDLSSMIDSQKKQVDKCEQQQHEELKVSSKRIRNEQEKELKGFRESLKQEVKLLKCEVELLPKDRRKEALKMRKDQLEREHVLRERGFVERLNESHESHMKRLSDTHREKVALLDRQFLQQKQQLMRAREAALWEMEERQLHERHQLAKRQLKDMFFLQRHQMLVHHEKELDHLKRMMERREEEMAKNQAVERRALPKRIRAEMKAREMMYRESLRISVTNLQEVITPMEEKDRFKKFQEAEKKRYRAEQQRFEMKHSKQLEEARAGSQAAVKELEQLQNEKRKMLMEHETSKLKELDESYAKEFKDWKADLKPRKQCLEEEFQGQLEEQESHYGHYLVSALAAERSRGTPGRSGEGGHNDSGRSSGSRYRPDITLGTSSIDRRSGKSVDRKSSDSDYSGSGSRRSSHDRRLSASRHSLVSRGSDL